MEQIRADTDGDGIVDGEEEFETDPLNPIPMEMGLMMGKRTSWQPIPQPGSDDDGWLIWKRFSRTDPLNPDEDGPTGDWDWGEPEVDVSALAGNYNVQFQFANSHTSYILCDYPPHCH